MTTLQPCADLCLSRPSRSETFILRLSAAAERRVERRIARRTQRLHQRSGLPLEAGLLDDQRTRASARSLGVWPG